MKVTYRTTNGRLTFEFESDNEKKLFADLSHIQEIFEESSCGCCQSDRIRFEVREFDKNKYYKLVCDQCGATLDFHQRKEGERLYLKDSDRASSTRGWYRHKDGERAPCKEGQAAAQPASTKPAPAANGKTQKPTPPSAQTTLDQHPPPMTSAEGYAKVLAMFQSVSTIERVEKWHKWAQDNFDFTPLQVDSVSDAKAKAIARLKRANFTPAPCRRGRVDEP